jgi:hypothetical protein
MENQKRSPSHGRKVFRHGLARAGMIAGVYAIYTGLLLIASTGVVLSPFMTQVLHAFHAEHDSSDGK